MTPGSHAARGVVVGSWSLGGEQDTATVEDDYEAEIRLQGPPLTLMKFADRSGRVVYMGTFSKYLASGLRGTWPPYLS